MNIKPHWSERSLWSAVLMTAIAVVAVDVHADEAASRPVPTRHQLMKDCHGQQKASDAGLSKEQMKKNCRDRHGDGAGKRESQQASKRSDHRNAADLTGTPRPSNLTQSGSWCLGRLLGRALRFLRTEPWDKSQLLTVAS